MAFLRPVPTPSLEQIKFLMGLSLAAAGQFAGLSQGLGISKLFPLSAL